MTLLRLTLIALLLPLSACAVEGKRLDIQYGANHIDINNDGVKDLITKVRWENLNAHSYDEYSVSMQYAVRENEEMNFYAVPLGNGLKKALHFSTSEGAGCVNPDYSIDVVTGYRFELNKAGWLQVTQFSRPTNEGYGAEAPVTITTYHLADIWDEPKPEEGPNQLPGDARFYLKKIKESTTKKKYCYVQDLMK